MVTQNWTRSFESDKGRHELTLWFIWCVVMTKLMAMLFLSLALWCGYAKEIRWRNRWQWPVRWPPPQHGILTSVDGTCCPYKEECLEDGSFDTGLFCHKFNGPGLNYEVVIGIYTGLVCSLKGPYKAGSKNSKGRRPGWHSSQMQREVCWWWYIS